MELTGRHPHTPQNLSRFPDEAAALLFRGSRTKVLDIASFLFLISEFSDSQDKAAAVQVIKDQLTWRLDFVRQRAFNA